MAQTSVGRIVSVFTEEIQSGAPALVTSTITTLEGHSEIGAHVFPDGEGEIVMGGIPSEDEPARPSLYPYWN